MCIIVDSFLSIFSHQDILNKKTFLKTFDDTLFVVVRAIFILKEEKMLGDKTR